MPRAKKTGLYRSKFENTLAQTLKRKRVKFKYETSTFPYFLLHHYTPDFVLTKGNKTIYIEAKGVFSSKDRTKMKAVRKQNPDLDIRIVFMNANLKLYKGSKTTYGEWATKAGFKWAEGEIPEEWLK